MKRMFPLLGLLLALLLAGCGSSPTAGPSKQAAARTPTPISLRTSPTTPPVPTATPLPVPVCPQLAAAPAGTAPITSPGLYLATPSTVLALNPADGSVRWQARVAQGNTTLAALAVDSNIVYAGTQAGEVVALDADNGKMRWCAAAAGPNPILEAAQGALYVGGNQSTTVIAFNADDGKQLWKTSVAGDVSSLMAGGGQLYVSAAAANGPAYFQALKPDTGAALWQKQISNAAFSQADMANGWVYVTEQPYGNYSGYLDAFDASGGTQRWQFQEPQGIGLSQPVLDSGEVYAIDSWGVYAFDAGGGAQRWSVQIQALNMSPRALNDLLYFLTVNGASGQQTVEALDVSNGAKRWSWSPTATALVAPGATAFSPFSSALPLAYTTGNGGVYVWYNGKVTALNGENGTQQWQAAINPGSPQVGVMVVG